MYKNMYSFTSLVSTAVMEVAFVQSSGSMFEKFDQALSLMIRNVSTRSMPHNALNYILVWCIKVYMLSTKIDKIHSLERYAFFCGNKPNQEIQCNVQKHKVFTLTALGR